jgi:hypothetical protein
LPSLLGSRWLGLVHRRGLGLVQTDRASIISVAILRQGSWLPAELADAVGAVHIKMGKPLDMVDRVDRTGRLVRLSVQDV